MIPHVRLVGVTKAYGAATVLREVSFDVLPGEVHVLAGENGAGKSTLMKVLGGVVTDYQGAVEIAGRSVRLRSPLDAAARGVATVHQELSLVPSMSIGDNLFLGEMPTRGGFVRRRAMEEAGREALAKVGLDLPLDTPAERLPIASQQLVEIAKALRTREGGRAKVVVMDEPTSALNVQEAERLFALIAELKASGVGIVYISHKMDEIERLADRITVLRDGEGVATRPAKEMPVAELVRLMVGTDVCPPPPVPLESGFIRSEGGVAFQARDVRIVRNGRVVVDGVGLSVRAGEVVGLAGLEGSGNGALLLGLFGAFGRIEGEVEIDGKPVSIESPSDAIRHRIALLTSDRKATGLILPLSVVANVTLASLPRLSKAGWRSDRREREAAERGTSELGVRTAGLEQPVGALSGGNQQKVALAKWLETDPKILFLDEPTRGIDVNAKREIYALVETWKAKGMAIVVITSELPELLLLADRIVVMHRGRLVTEMTRAEATSERVVGAAMDA